ncbi:hypothetical protein JXA85_07300 [Candidatus Woesearchaeota archaeon]|nr:hypothetical protein [Candidatus Woesearchaeota archaeon]
MQISPEISKTATGECDTYGHCEQIINIENLNLTQLEVQDVKYYFPESASNIELYKGKWLLIEKVRNVTGLKNKTIDDDCYIDYGVSEEQFACYVDGGFYPCEYVENNLCYYNGPVEEVYEDWDWQFTPLNPKSMSIVNFQRLKITYDVPSSSSGKWNISIVINDTEYLLDPGWNASYKSYEWSDTYGLLCRSTNSSDPLSFRDIYDYFQEYPLSANYEFPRLYGGNPYELMENGDWWHGASGLTNATNDTTTYDNSNNVSIRFNVTSIPITYNATRFQRRVDTYGSLIYIYMPSTSGLSTMDHVLISGSSVQNGIFYVYDVYSTYIRVFANNEMQDDADVTENFTVKKPLTIIYNEDGSEDSFDTWASDEIVFSAKTNNSAKIIGLAVRTYLGSGTYVADRLYYGVQGLRNYSINDTWQEFEFNIRNDTVYHSIDSRIGSGGASEYRTYWQNTKQVHVFFDNLSVNDTVWMDGLRFVASDRNPQIVEGKSNAYEMLGLYIDNYFKDRGFNLRMTGLDGRVHITATDYGNIELGDYSGNYSNDGGQIYFTLYGGNAGGYQLYLNHLYIQGVSFLWDKAVYGADVLLGYATTCRDCGFTNNYNYFSGAGSWNFLGGYWSGGRYALVATVSSVDKFTIYKTNYYQLFPTSATISTYKNLKIIDDTPNKNIIYTYNVGYSANKDQARFINFDISECNNPRYRITCSYSVYGDNVYIAFSLNAKLRDEDGDAIEGATVLMTDKIGNVLFTNTTDSLGEIEEQTIDIMKAYANSTWGSGYYYYFDTPDVDWITYYPFTLTISKEGYQTYTTQFLTEGYNRSNNIVKNGADLIISLKEAAAGTVDVFGTEYAAGEEGTVYAQVTYQNGTIANDANCNVSIFLRNNTQVSDAVMYYIAGSNGGYYYNFTVPNNISVFMTNVYCTNPSAYGSSDFHVSSWATDLTQGLKLYAYAGPFYSPSDEVVVYTITTDNPGSLINATVDVEVFYPNGTSLAAGEAAYYETGRANYTLTLSSSSPQGNYRIEVDSNYSSYSAHLTLSFLISNVLQEITYLVAQINQTITDTLLTMVSDINLSTQNRLISIQNNISTLSDDVAGLNITINSTLSSILLEVDSLEELHQCSESPNSTICNLLNLLRNDTQSIYALSSSINTTVYNISRAMSSDFHVRLSDFGEVAAGSDFLMKIWITDYLQNPKNADSTPTVLLYDPVRNAVGPLSMSLGETGIYSFNYTTTSSMADGVWETVVTTIVNGVTNKYSDFWELESSPAEVRINDITDKTVPTITADVTVTNEGTGTQEYQYEYCLVSEQSNSCGGTDDVCYGSGAKLIYPSQSWNTQLSCSEVADEGNYWFKILVYYGTEVSGASSYFTASRETSVQSSGSSGGGASSAGGAVAVTDKTEQPIQKVTESAAKEIEPQLIAKIKLLEYPGILKLEINETKTMEIVVRNNGDIVLHNLGVTIFNLPPELYIIPPVSVSLEPNQTQIFTIRFKPSYDKGQYLAKLVIASDEYTKEENFMVIIGQTEHEQKHVMATRTLYMVSLVVTIVSFLAVVVFLLSRERMLRKKLRNEEEELFQWRSKSDIEKEISEIGQYAVYTDALRKGRVMDEKGYARLRKKLEERFRKLKKESESLR